MNVYGNFIDQNVKNETLCEMLLTLEHKSVPVQRGIYLVPSSAQRVINGKNVLAKSKINNGRSGKGFTTLWYVDGERVSKANLESAIAA